MTQDSKVEEELSAKNLVIAGVDEVGRGSLVGPVVACAFIFDNLKTSIKVCDSKSISKIKRIRLFYEILQTNSLFSLGLASHKEIDQINILNATKLAMKRAVEGLRSKPDILLIDGNNKIKSDINQKCIIKGDAICKSIGAASIVAKVSRDSLMNKLSSLFPLYELNTNKGYGTKKHKKLISKYGITPIHRKSFKLR